MKTNWFFLFMISSLASSAQSIDRDLISNTCDNYFEVFYNGDTSKLKETFKVDMYKIGYSKGSSGDYVKRGPMTYNKALDYSLYVLKNPESVPKDAPREISVMDVGKTIAVAKITAWWGIDYLLLTKSDDQWLIEQVLWEGK